MDWQEIMTLKEFQDATELTGTAYFVRSQGRLSQLDTLLEQYHQTRKRDLGTRIGQLGHIKTAAGSWLMSPPKGGFGYGIPATTALGVEELAEQAGNKCRYLQAIESFYLTYPSETTATLKAFESVAETSKSTPIARPRRASFSGHPTPPPTPTPTPTATSTTTPTPAPRKTGRGRAASLPTPTLAPQKPTQALPLGHHYLVERADPVHRSTHAVPSRPGIGMGKLLEMWTAARTAPSNTNGATDLPFFYWLEEQDPKDLEMKTVAYLSKSQRRKYLVFVIDGEFKCVIDHETQAFSTEGKGSLSDGKPDWCIFVLSPGDVLFAGGYEMGEFHHSSFLSGSKVQAAGQLCVINGKLIGITPKSGHYKPGPEELCATLTFLKARKVRLNQVEIWYPDYSLSDPESNPFRINAAVFLRNRGAFDKTTTERVPKFLMLGGRPNPEMEAMMAEALRQ